MKREKVVGHNDKDGMGKNGKDKKNKTNLMMQLPLTSIPWYVQFRRLATYKQDRREYLTIRLVESFDLIPIMIS